jgi:hypothetical protein
MMTAIWRIVRSVAPLDTRAVFDVPASWKIVSVLLPVLIAIAGVCIPAMPERSLLIGWGAATASVALLCRAFVWFEWTTAGALVRHQRAWMVYEVALVRLLLPTVLVGTCWAVFARTEHGSMLRIVSATAWAVVVGSFLLVTLEPRWMIGVADVMYLLGDRPSQRHLWDEGFRPLMTLEWVSVVVIPTAAACIIALEKRLQNLQRFMTASGAALGAALVLPLLVHLVARNVWDLSATHSYILLQVGVATPCGSAIGVVYGSGAPAVSRRVPALAAVLGVALCVAVFEALPYPEAMGWYVATAATVPTALGWLARAGGTNFRAANS